jgi:hypothetical protein
VHVDSAFCEFSGYDTPGRYRCRAQVTVSRYDTQPHILELDTKLGDRRA